MDEPHSLILRKFSLTGGPDLNCKNSNTRQQRASNKENDEHQAGEKGKSATWVVFKTSL